MSFAENLPDDSIILLFTGKLNSKECVHVSYLWKRQSFESVYKNNESQGTFTKFIICYQFEELPRKLCQPVPNVACQRKGVSAVE